MMPIISRLLRKSTSLFDQIWVLDNSRKLTADKAVRLVYDGAKLKDGTYELKVTGRKDGRTYTARQKIRKLPYRKGEVWIDKNQVTHVDGKPFHLTDSPFYACDISSAMGKKIATNFDTAYSLAVDLDL